MYALDDVLVATDLLENSDTLVDSGSGLYATFTNKVLGGI